VIERLPRYAETELQRLCAKAGALCHSVDEDESGWDRLVEFPEKELLGPADTRPPRAVAYVQVKSVEKGALTCRVKLTNALRAAQSPQPWFIMLVTGEMREQPSRIYAVHVWEELIRRTLKAVRRAHNEGRSLNKSSLTIRFSQGDEKGDGLVQWMQDAIDAVSPDYEAAKRAINRTAGYEDGYGDAALTIEADNEEEILKNLLGLGKVASHQQVHFHAEPVRNPIASAAIRLLVWSRPHHPPAHRRSGNSPPQSRKLSHDRAARARLCNGPARSA
jgi:hypothetical protein